MYLKQEENNYNLITKESNNEPLVYTLERPHQKSQNQPSHLGTNQSRSLGTGPLGMIDRSVPNSSSLSVASPNQEPSDLDIHIVVRKRTQTRSRNLKYPITNSNSYKKLSHTHKASTSKISHVIIPRNIKKDLADSN